MNPIKGKMPTYQRILMLEANMSRTYKDKPTTFSVKRGIPSSFKKMRNRIRRAKVKYAMIHGLEIPKFKIDDSWNWY